MPTLPTPVNITKNTVDILNAIRNEASISYQERIPVATKESIKEYGSALMDYKPAANEFIDALVNRIGLVIIRSRLYSCPYKFLHKGTLTYGETIEEVFTKIAKAKVYNPEVAESEWMKREMPDVASIFHKLNYKNFFKVTIERRELERAFLSENGVYQLVSDIVNSLYGGMEYDEFLIIKQLIVEYAKKGLMYQVEIPEVTADTMTSIIAKVKAMSNKLTFMSTEYNAMGVPTYTDKSSQVIFIDAEFDALMDVEVLATAFNMDKAEFMGRRVLIDDFAELTGAKILLCDEWFFQIYDTLLEFESERNPEGLYWNYWLHRWAVFSVSRFANAVLFTTDESKSEVTGLEMTPTNYGVEDDTIPRQVEVTAIIEKTGEADEELIWSISGQTSPQTNFTNVDNNTIRVYVAEGEPVGTTITVKAESKYFPVSAQMTIDIVNALP